MCLDPHDVIKRSGGINVPGNELSGSIASGNVKGTDEPFSARGTLRVAMLRHDEQSQEHDHGCPRCRGEPPGWSAVAEVVDGYRILLPDGHKLWSDWLRRIDTLLEDEA